MKSGQKFKSQFPETLRKLWLHQLCFLAKRKKAPENPRQVESFFNHLIERYRHQIVSLWSSYNVQRSKTQYLRLTEAQHSTSYMMAFHTGNLQRNYQIFQRTTAETGLFDKLKALPSVHLIDLGAGGGAWSAAALESLSGGSQKPQIYVDLIDRSKYLLLAAHDGIQHFYSPKSLKVLNADLRDEKVEFVLKKILSECEKEKRFVVLGMSYVWNEINSAKAKTRLLDLFSQIFHSNLPVAFSFSEPGREQEAREAMDFRQWLVDQNMTPLYPCPSSASCPMIMSGIDWCYSEVSDHNLEEWKYISKVLKLSRQKLATSSYLALNKAALELLKIKAPQGHPRRVVGFPEVSGFKQTLICTGDRLLKEKFFSPSLLRGEPLSQHVKN